ncbi:MAG: hypothetical protein JNK19_08575 [Tabrizicola sp.]|nr:hypothetical protein [Tabrizicola sp.]
MKSKAPATAAVMAACCFDFLKDGMKPITHPQAVAALTRAFRRMIEAGGKPLAIPVSETEALGFPERRPDHLPGGVTWLAVGLDVQGRGAYALHSALSEDKATAHEVARTLALARLAEVCSFPGFPQVAKGGVA